MDNILVTGGAGFIGSHVVERIIRSGKRVAVVDNLDEYYDPELKRANLREVAASGKFEFHALDIRDAEGVERVFRDFQPEAVVHLAARPGVRASFLQPDLCASVNVMGTLRLLETSRQSGVLRFIFASSSSVYGRTNRAPFTEDAATNHPLSIYAATKASGEALAYTFSQAYKLPVVCLRLFTVFGPRQRPDLAIRKFATLLLAGEEVPVFGDGSLQRDFTYVDDIVDGILRALDIPTAFDVFNLGNSRPVELNDMIETLAREMGKPVRKKFLPVPPGEMTLTHADLSKSRRMLGYSPQVSFEEGIRRFVGWLNAAK